MRTHTNRRFLDALGERVLIFDGAMGTSLEAMALSEEAFGDHHLNGCYDCLILSTPDAIQQVHESFLEAGADVIETNTFRSNRITLAEFGLEDNVLTINRQAAELARRTADTFSTPGQQRFVAGAMGPSGKLPSSNDPTLSDISFDELAEVFNEQATGLIQGSVDLLLIETAQDLLEVRAAIEGIQRAFKATNQRLPIQVQVTLDTTGRMLLGTDISAALAALERLPIDVIGLNCSTGPVHMREPIRYLGEHAALPVSCLPNAGLPINVDGRPVYPLGPEPFATDLIDFVEKHNISIVGGCCGTTPAHIRLLASSLRDHPLPSRPPSKEAKIASAMRAIPIAQEPRPLLIGERINTQGSRRAKELTLAGDFESLVELARQQVEQGAHALDVCVALTESSGEAATMASIVHLLSSSVDAPLVIDSTEPEVMEAALKTLTGRSILNSVNLEAGREKLERILGLAATYGSAVIGLTIDEEGMAIEAGRKVAIARRIHDIAVMDFSLHAEDLIIDPLTFTLATGDPEYRDSAIETIEAIRRIKAELPGVFTSLGISNVSFGLSAGARSMLNSVMLYHCVQAGLDLAIVNPAHVRPLAEIPELERELAEDLIYNRRDDALERLIDHFQKVRPAHKTQEAPDPLADKSAEERIFWRILHRHKKDIERDIDEIINRNPKDKESATAVTILNEVLLPAMKEVGDRFGAGELILPFVLQSAEVMKKAVSHLEKYLERTQGLSKGRIVLATVYGDVHDIGKNLVKTILVNNGYEVHDLGKQVPANVILDTAEEVGADAIGLSALLVSTSRQMPLIVNELKRRRKSTPVLIGGAAINRKFGRRILITEDGTPYEGGVFYCKDAFEGLQVMDRLLDPAAREELLDQLLASPDAVAGAPSTKETKDRPRRTIASPDLVPTPPSWGPKVVLEMPLEMVFQHIHKPELYRLSWGAKNTRGEEWRDMRKRFDERLARMQQEALHEGWLRPQGVYGYWPAQSQGNDLVIFDPTSLEKGRREELLRFSFPRQPSSPNLCLADYFHALGSGRMDVVALQVVTVGPEASRKIDAMQGENAYSEAYFTHGLAVQMAEASAEYLHRHISRELDIPPGQGKRYSWGYPAIPELADHEKVVTLLPVEEKLGLKLSPAYQFIPEQSTAAIIVHHPKAKYFSVGRTRLQQLVEEG